MSTTSSDTTATSFLYTDAEIRSRKHYLHRSSPSTDSIKPVRLAYPHDDSEPRGTSHVAAKDSLARFYTAKHHVGAFLRLLSEESGNASSSSQSSDQEVALSKAVDVMEETMGANPVSSQSKKEKHKEYETQCREKLSTGSEVKSTSEVENDPPKTAKDDHSADVSDAPRDSGHNVDEEPVEEEKMLSIRGK
ncbi:hypothetical protein NC653_018406 [Populus alba x Populus x berolinensis]|uniref:Uncharacterized protein n=1 Tax=Populus alba x Populus x berolinensis TaxID=444605 RepID=A0AAD6QGD6_9ROSI|nr:hypothetical protein NC653_018406 [Populus alba x Populus x berolinensis]